MTTLESASWRRWIANFLIRTCGFRRLHGTAALRIIRTFFDEIDFQYLRDTHRCRVCADRLELYQYVNSEILSEEPIDFLEFGVYRGESIREWTVLNKHRASRFYGFDSFEGLPEAWRSTQDKGHFSLGGNIPDLSDDRVVFLKGWFDNTVPTFVREFVPRNRLVVHLDADLYASTLLPLIYLNPFLAKDSLLLFDEFYDRDHEFKAFQDYLRIAKKSFRICCQTDDYGKLCVQLL